jgi:hypothetical protein
MLCVSCDKGSTFIRVFKSTAELFEHESDKLDEVVEDVLQLRPWVRPGGR